MMAIAIAAFRIALRALATNHLDGLVTPKSTDSLLRGAQLGCFHRELHRRLIWRQLQFGCTLWQFALRILSHGNSNLESIG